MPAVIASGCLVAKEMIDASSPQTASAIRRHNPLRYSLKSVATWSLRLRAVCRARAGSPIISPKRLSTKVKMSSSSASSGNPCSSIWSLRRDSPETRASDWSREIIPVAPSISAWAMLAAMSSR